jgi:hypothetical protein
MALLMAATSSQQVVRNRFRPTEQLREQALILCEVPTSGSFALPITLACGQIWLPFRPGKPIGLLQALHMLLEAIATDIRDLVAELVPDSAIRVRTYRELQRLLPQPGEPWAIGFSSFERPETILDERATHRVEEWIATDAAPEDTVMTVTGELVRVFFEEKRITIRYKPTNRTIDCYLQENVVDAILEDRRAKLRTTGTFKIQVTGQFILDRNGHPTKLTNVYRVHPVDTSPMIFERIHYRSRRFEIHPPLKLEPALDDESGQLYVAADEELGIHAYAHTREQLAEEIAEQIAFNWDEYAKEAPEKLAKGALRIREIMLARVEEIHA